MFCSKCGSKLAEDSRFCNGCGWEIKSDANEEVSLPKNGHVDKLSIISNVNEIHFDSKKIEFKDALGKLIIKAERNTNGLLKAPSFEFIGTHHDGSPDKFMVSKVKEGDNAFTQTAYTNDGNVIGSATYSGGLKSMAKTTINIVDEKGQSFMLDEEVGKIKGLLKIVSPVDYGIGAFASARTGDMKIKLGDTPIGIIKSVRGATHNTFIIQDCQNLMKQIDIRLVVLGLVVKAINTK